MIYWGKLFYHHIRWGVYKTYSIFKSLFVFVGNWISELWNYWVTVTRGIDSISDLLIALLLYVKALPASAILGFYTTKKWYRTYFKYLNGSAEQIDEGDKAVVPWYLWSLFVIKDHKYRNVAEALNLAVDPLARLIPRPLIIEGEFRHVGKS